MLDAFAQHVEQCPQCQETIASLGDRDDTLLAQIRRPPSQDAYAQEPECQQVVARAKSLAVIAAGISPGGPAPPEFPPPDPEAEGLSDLGRLGEYELLAKLGEGGMGAVYKARQVRLDKIVALKVLPKKHTADPHAVARLEREMKAVGRVAHPNVVQAHDARDIDGTTVLVMEYVEGRDLSDVVKRLGMLPIAEACEIARQTALGLAAAHAQGSVHRDIKPSNLILAAIPSPSGRGARPAALHSPSGGGAATNLPSPSGRGAGGEGVWSQGLVKILDLGLARLGTEKPEGVELTSSGAAMGTADYMAPEQVSDAHTVNARADIYSLGRLREAPGGQATAGGRELLALGFVTPFLDPVITDRLRVALHPNVGQQAVAVRGHWQPHYKVSHVSGPHAIWIEEEKKLFVCYHGENNVTRFASTRDGIRFF